MKRLALLLAPSLVLAGTYSGSVALLDGTPVVGAVVRVGTDSVLSTGAGFRLSGSLGVGARASHPGARSVRWTLEEGRLRATYLGRDLSGRMRSANTSVGVPGKSVESSAPVAAARFAAAPETLSVFWKGKRLVVLLVSGDTSVSLRVDTAWGDDAGIPWNPRVTYASLRDSRDGQTYRTVTIGTTSWMAENLSWKGAAADSFPFMGLPKFGRAYARTRWSDTLCPSGWRLPYRNDWNAVTTEAVRGMAFLQQAGTILKSSSGWDSTGNGLDSYGFRGLPGGMLHSTPRVANVWAMPGGRSAFWALARDTGELLVGRMLYNSPYANPIGQDTADIYGFWLYSVRCIED
jgi:uncharacterized protein (TIGR02145 family)